MIQRPNAVALTICRHVIIEEGTRNPSLINCFSRLKFREFPAPTGRFFACVTLTDGIGTWPFDLVVSRPDTLDDLYSRRVSVAFTNPLRSVRLLIPISGIELPIPGFYPISFLLEENVLAQCVVEVIELEGLDE